MLILSIAIIGLFAGTVGGMLGVGGSIVIIPALTEILGPNQHLYQAAAMVVNVFVVIPAIRQHVRARAIVPAVVLRLLPITILLVFVGVGLSETALFTGVNETRLRFLFGLFLVLLAGYDLYRLVRRRVADQSQTSPVGEPSGGPDVQSTRTVPAVTWWNLCLVGVPTGLASGLFGIGGGSLSVPLQRRFLKMPLRSAIANSSTLMGIPALLGATMKNVAYAHQNDPAWEPVMLAAILVPTAMIGSYVGSHLTHRLPLSVVRISFMILLAVAGMRMIHGAFFFSE